MAMPEWLRHMPADVPDLKCKTRSASVVREVTCFVTGSFRFWHQALWTQRLIQLSQMHVQILHIYIYIYIFFKVLHLCFGVFAIEFTAKFRTNIVPDCMKRTLATPMRRLKFFQQGMC